MERVKGIEPSSSAWKAVALPLSYTRIRNRNSEVGIQKSVWAWADSPSYLRRSFRILPSGLWRTDGGGGWIRTSVGVANGFTVRPL